MHQGEQKDREREEQQRLQARMARIAHKVLVLSGKGGVGKSTVAVNLALALMLEGRRVGLLDVDIHGPSVPHMLGLAGEPILTEAGAMLPVELGDLKVMSIAFLLSRREDAVIWRGPMKMGVIRQFLADVEWGDLDVLVVDAPPGTGDEPLSVCQLIGDADGAIVVTSPQEVAVAAVRRSITFCRQLQLPVLGVIENMSGFICPRCGEHTPIFGTAGGERMAKEMGVPFLGRIPLDPRITEAGDAGMPYVRTDADSPAAKCFAAIVRAVPGLDRQPVRRRDTAEGAPEESERDGGDGIPAGKEVSMRIAIPLAGGKLSQHFGHCERFALVDVDTATKKILSTTEVQAPEHQPGLFPRWLAGQGARLVIAGGMGGSAQGLFAQSGITVVTGAPAESPEAVVTAWMEGTLRTGANVCDH
jgi:Mrp family chromosome partitioning ATPase/predicted Fe-Mo cluster-binding NifX family protein